MKIYKWVKYGSCGDDLQIKTVAPVIPDQVKMNCCVGAELRHVQKTDRCRE